ncbi:MAG: aminomethyl-transferring glycine dehydrogenase subunit GcvPB [Deltaproteobacteria bacterium]|nr:aminomethyl-transferring glycine dehydrogenase subunit GcvPB [Deltaproteobacteria bacterium]
MGQGTDRRVGIGREEPLLLERSKKGRKGYSVAGADSVSDRDIRIPAGLLRDAVPGIPEADEVTVVRHFTRLSQWNYGVDTGMYPLGSCTMKYNPKVNEAAARHPIMDSLHPYTPESMAQGALALVWRLERALAELSGFERVTLQPAAGAHGELCGIMMVRAHFSARGERRRKVLIPDTAHGTNPASSALVGCEVVQVKSGSAGIVEAGTLEQAVDGDTAAFMMTNPNTLGLFESEMPKIAGLLHDKGALLYCDGANFNSLMGIARPGDMGVDVMQFNLHKTFSTPHGGGGPGAGPVGVSKTLEPYLPVPVIEKVGDTFRASTSRPLSIGRMKAFYGNFGVLLRAFTYIAELGAPGLKKATGCAVLNANYVLERLRGDYHVPYAGRCMHECVLTDKNQSVFGVTTLDIAKRLMDHGFHPPTIYFPLVVHGALMIEPTESESLESLDEFVEAMKAIAAETRSDPGAVKAAPTLTPVARMDEIGAARNPCLVSTVK